MARKRQVKTVCKTEGLFSGISYPLIDDHPDLDDEKIKKMISKKNYTIKDAVDVFVDKYAYSEYGKPPSDWTEYWSNSDLDELPTDNDEVEEECDKYFDEGFIEGAKRRLMNRKNDKVITWLSAEDKKSVKRDSELFKSLYEK